ncbi:glycerophosphodiester phosphodiesterase [Catellatospora sp. TT07R-123]|uniref:glycerophosphodiester phosphodiesterase n=1 Tax=Catellatospora sp. TT07R-123 TaxID=2733863 RepID=UPI001FD170FA|nr:glycerophosphodiester phosphodiesterase [Catellatospora sp. TT07R-123]
MNTPRPLHPYLAQPPLAFAHRGGAAEGDENTADAFARSVAAGYRYVETDVHATRDGVAVVLHDPDLRRVAGEPVAVASVTWQDLASVRVGGAAAVPRLDEVLDAWPEIRFNIDVKDDRAVEPTVAVVRARATPDQVLLASFSDARLRRVRELAGPAYATSLAQKETARLWLASRFGGRVKLPPSVVAAQVPVRFGAVRVVDRRFVAHAHRLGLQVHVWTIDDPAEMAGLLDLGVDGIMTDRIDVLREVFVDRGLWKDHP